MSAAQNDPENALSPVTSGLLQQLADGLREHSGFVDVLTSLQQGHGGTIGGTWGAASSLAVAAIASARAKEQEGLIVVVVPHAVDADIFADDLALLPPWPLMFYRLSNQSMTSQPTTKHSSMTQLRQND